MLSSTHFESFMLRLRTRKSYNSISTATSTIILVKQLLSRRKLTSTKHVYALFDKLLEATEKSAISAEFCITNMTKRLSYLAKEEENILTQELVSENKLTGLGDIVTSINIDTFISRIKQSIEELIDELNNTIPNIISYSLHHVRPNEVILTAGNSSTVNQFLIVASCARNLKVMVMNTGSSFLGHKAAVELSTKGVDTVVISDAAIMAVMPSVNRVIMGARSVTANGGIIAVSGSYILAAAANSLSVPVAVLVGLHKVSPIYPYNELGFSLCRSPENIYPSEVYSSLEDKRDAEIVDPTFDYIPPEKISMFITSVYVSPGKLFLILKSNSESGCCSPSLIHQMVRDTYAL